MSNKQYKIWIDILKGVCMICVYLCHSEGYYDARENLGYIAKPFYVNAFFFVSGYLFFGKWLNVNMLNRGGVFARAQKYALPIGNTYHPVLHNYLCA